MPRQGHDLHGHQSGMLVVLGIDPSAERGAGKSIKWIVQCDCGREVSLRSHAIINHQQYSCGCRQGRKRPEMTKLVPLKKLVHVVDIERLRERNREKVRKYNARNRELVRQRGKAWSQANRHINAARVARRRAAKSMAIPAWADKLEIARIYAERPLGYEVDHIVPLQSPIVCGLHWERNLQYLTAEENRKKYNRLIEAAHGF